MGPWANGQDGRVYCAAEPDDTAVMGSRGGIVCGASRCAQDVVSGQIMCSRKPGGDAIRTLDGVSCLGGCETATQAHCEGLVVE